jgi:Dolichyl-phosphate-mannose-protein mannosyltransferase
MLSSITPSARKRAFLFAHTALIVLTLLRVASTHRVFSQTLDEPVHIGVGYDWLRGLPYHNDARNPPLPRVLAALPLLLTHPPLSASNDIATRGNDLLYYGDHYERTLARCRWGNLLLLAVAMINLGWWAARQFNRAVSLIAVALFATMPAILGHAGLATTDLSNVATLTLAVVVLDWFLDRPTSRRGATLGICIALGILAKFTFIPFFFLSAIVLAAIRPPSRAALGPALLALITAFLVVWVGYRFETGRISDAAGNSVSYVTTAAPKFSQTAVKWMAEHVPLPAPSILIGMSLIKVDDDLRTYDAYLFGRFRSGGFWYYFPAVFFFKTPFPFLILCLWGAAFLVVRAWRTRTWRGLELLAIALIPFLTLMRSSLNLGVRHVLAVYAPLSIIAAVAVIEIWRTSSDLFGRLALAGLLVWLFAGTAIAHPDYLPWFNAAAGPNPEHVAIDSNLDWGQDMLRLGRAVRARHIDQLYVLVVTTSRFERLGARCEFLEPFTLRHDSWIAVSESALALMNRNHEYDWLSVYQPVERVGKTIQLYHIP